VRQPALRQSGHALVNPRIMHGEFRLATSARLDWSRPCAKMCGTPWRVSAAQRSGAARGPAAGEDIRYTRWLARGWA